MKKQQRDAFRIHQMVQASEKIARFINGREFNDLLTDDMLASAIERQLEIISEAVSHLSQETYVEWPRVDWRGMKSARNFIAHKYFWADYSKIWDIIQQLIPVELEELKDVLATLEARFGSPDDDIV